MTDYNLVQDHRRPC